MCMCVCVCVRACTRVCVPAFVRLRVYTSVCVSVHACVRVRCTCILFYSSIRQHRSPMPHPSHSHLCHIPNKLTLFRLCVRQLRDAFKCNGSGGDGYGDGRGGDVCGGYGGGGARW